MITGICWVRGSDFSRRQTSKPSMPGHHHIEQHHIGAFVGTDLKRLTAAPSGAYFEILRGQPRLEQFDIGVDVVDQHDSCGH